MPHRYKKPIAVLCVRDQPHYRRRAFLLGLNACGYDVRPTIHTDPSPNDVLVIWNRYGDYHKNAEMFERAGASVLVVENGYVGHDEQGRQYYAIARHHHNGAGEWYSGRYDRWSDLNIAVAPWRETGNHILILPQRGIGPPGVAMPTDWPEKAAERLRAITKRPVRIRPHPKKERPPLGPDFEDCWAAVVWASTAGIKAIIAGIPVFYEMRRWIGRRAAKFGFDDIENPFLGDRRSMLHEMAWAQWSVEEIEKGEPFKCLLSK